MAKERDYELQPQAVAKLRQHLAERKRDTLFAFSNARYVRNMIERAIRHQAVRLLNLYGSGQPGRQELMTLRAEDLRWEPEDA
jgi:stage V sporulation protein K